MLLAESIHLIRRQATLQERAGVDAGGGVALDEDLVAAAGMGLTPEEMVEADLVERGRGGVGGDVPADAHTRALRAVHHDCGVPPDPPPVAALDLLVTGEPGLQLGRDGVDIVGGGQRGDGNPLLAGPFEQSQHQIAGPGRPGAGQQGVEGFQPFGGLIGVDIRQIRRHTVADDPNAIGFLWITRALTPVMARELGRQLPLLDSRWEVMPVLWCRTHGIGAA